ncbi:acyltransferase family protein [Streptosporangium carneum]|uniref:Acyltransferase n=1 Tax=Streptosporangium carneum TaxID=47481 RepID=A0A9W6HYW1_9ACTN|nr:acyltransferase family protein [Streptosporangium carneum]GLK08602.1 acyltransferase [Streptosporangium carneum]
MVRPTPAELSTCSCGLTPHASSCEPQGEHAGGRSSASRADIQGLRAIAVAAVVAFHLWPGGPTGGYVGVDVFFVISGYLITSHLLRQPGHVGRRLLDFWARRIRRLIPAASLALLVTLAASVVWLPLTVLGTAAREVIAAAVYAENLRLAFTQANYLNADQPDWPAQHYWSLSIEEQLYVVWPLLLGMAAWPAARVVRGRRRPESFTRWSAVVVGGVVVAVSLAWSVDRTAADPAAAYFVSTTRFWELALGGLVAAVLTVRAAPRARTVRVGLAWAGLGMIVWAVVRFDSETAFPGAVALMPTVGTCLVIAAAADGLRGGPGRLLAWRPVQWLGDTSYAVYLWHWPLIMIFPYVLGRSLTVIDSLAVIAMTLLLAAFSQHLVEDRLRWHPVLVRSRKVTFAMLASCVVIVGGAGAGVAAYADAAERTASATFEAAAARAGACLGAGVVRDPACEDPGLLMPPQIALKDKPAVYADGCVNKEPFIARNTCTYGPDTGGKRIALVGNSHAGHWVPALEKALWSERWRLTTYVQLACYTVDQPIVSEGAGVSENCQKINRWAVGSIVKGGYDLVIMSNRTHEPLADVSPAGQEAAAERAYRGTLRAFTGAGLPVLVLRDTPAMPDSVPHCIAKHPDDIDSCGGPTGVVLRPDPLAAAARADTTGLVSVASLDDLMCGERCRPVIGGLIAYSDRSHLTTTFARTLAPEVTAAVRGALTR